MTAKKEPEKWLTIKDIQRHLAERKQFLIAQYEADGDEPPFDVLYGDGRIPKDYPPPEVWLAKRYEANALQGIVTARAANIQVAYPPPNSQRSDYMGEPEREEARRVPPIAHPEIPDGVPASKKHGRKLAMPDPAKLSPKQREQYVRALRTEESMFLAEADEASDRNEHERAQVAGWLAEEVRADILRMQSCNDIWTALARVASESDPAIATVEEHVQKLDTALQGAVRTMHQIMQHNQAPQYGPFHGPMKQAGPVAHPPDFGPPQARYHPGIPPPEPRR